MPRPFILLQMLQMLQKFCNKKEAHFELLLANGGQNCTNNSLLQMLQGYIPLAQNIDQKYRASKNGVTFVTIVTNGAEKP